MVVPLILGSDKTLASNVTGQNEFHLSRPDSRQTKFSHICQDIRDIKTNSYSRHNKIQRITNMSTNPSSTKVLHNHKPPDCDKSGGDDLDASNSVYTPSLERTMGRNSRTRTNCAVPLCGTSPTPPQLSSLPPSYPESPLYSETPLSPAVSTASISVRAQFFTFQISTFDKSRFPRALIIAWKSHHSPYPLVFLPPLRFAHQDEHGQEHRTRLMVSQSCPKTTTTTSVTRYINARCHDQIIGKSSSLIFAKIFVTSSQIIISGMAKYNSI